MDDMDTFQRWEMMLKYFHDNLRSGLDDLLKVAAPGRSIASSVLSHAWS